MSSSIQNRDMKSNVKDPKTNQDIKEIIHKISHSIEEKMKNTSPRQPLDKSDMSEVSDLLELKEDPQNKGILDSKESSTPSLNDVRMNPTRQVPNQHESLKGFPTGYEIQERDTVDSFGKNLVLETTNRTEMESPSLKSIPERRDYNEKGTPSKSHEIQKSIVESSSVEKKGKDISAKVYSNLKHHLEKLNQQTLNYEQRPSLNKLRNIFKRIQRASKWIDTDGQDYEYCVDIVEQFFWLVDTIDREESNNLQKVNVPSSELLSTETSPLMQYSKTSQIYQSQQVEFESRKEILEEIRREKEALKTWVQEAYVKHGKEFVTNELILSNPNVGWLHTDKLPYSKTRIRTILFIMGIAIISILLCFVFSILILSVFISLRK